VGERRRRRAATVTSYRSRYSGAVTERAPDELRAFASLDFGPLEHPPSWARGVWRLTRRMPPWLEVALVALAMAAGATAVILLFVGIPLGGVPARAAFFAVCFAVSIAVVVGVIAAFRVWNRRHGRRLVPVGPELPGFATANGFEFRAASVVERELPAPAGLEGEVQRVGQRLAPAEGSPWPRFVLGSRLFHTPVPEDVPPTAERPYPVRRDEGLFVAVPLPRLLPHIALVRRGEASDSNLDLTAAYSMGLEFDRAFTLLCPPGYERDALYLFTPDVMAAMIDDAGAAQWGAEVIDDWLFFRFPYSSQPNAVFLEDLRRAFLLVERTAAELAKQARGYRDERVGDRTLDRVSDAGRRLRTRVRRTTLVAAFGLPAMVIAPTAVVVAAAVLFPR